jgi:hypothetical protein
MKKNTRVKITGIPENIWASCYNGMVGITLDKSTAPHVAINGIQENNHYFYEGHLTPVKPSIDTLCVGDVLVDTDGEETRVLAMQGDSFLKGYTGNFPGNWFTKDQAKHLGWTVKEENLIRWKKWDTGETGTWDDDKEEIAYFGSGWTQPYPYETRTWKPGETGTKNANTTLPDRLEFDDIKSWHKSYTNGPPITSIMGLVAREVKKERKRIAEMIKDRKREANQVFESHEYDDCFDSLLRILEDNEN